MFPEKQMPYAIYNTAVYVNSRHKITHTHTAGTHFIQLTMTTLLTITATVKSAHLQTA